ncbi:hypothetical protein [Streptomyces sp. NPDC059256]
MFVQQGQFGRRLSALVDEQRSVQRLARLPVVPCPARAWKWKS